MKEYDELADELNGRAAQLGGHAQHWIGLAGAPGSGKSTLAAALRERLGERLTLIPMDGYHYYRQELDAMSDPKNAHARRGAPFTFNAPRLVAELLEARESGTGSFPDFDHGVGDPVEDVTVLTNEIPRIVMVEGNYLLLDDEPWCRLREQVFDETWFLDVPVAECMRRIYQRHLTTGQTAEGAQRRVATNDSINADLVIAASVSNADRVLRICQLGTL
jgi:pantothenate kinase